MYLGNNTNMYTTQSRHMQMSAAAMTTAHRACSSRSFSISCNPTTLESAAPDLDLAPDHSLPVGALGIRPKCEELIEKQNAPSASLQTQSTCIDITPTHQQALLSTPGSHTQGSITIPHSTGVLTSQLEYCGESFHVLCNVVVCR